MTIQLYYPEKDEQFTIDARITRGICFDTVLPDGTKCVSIRTDTEMAQNLIIKPCDKWEELPKTKSK